MLFVVTCCECSEMLLTLHSKLSSQLKVVKKQLKVVN